MNSLIFPRVLSTARPVAIAVLLVVVAPLCWASEASNYCNEMYPAESYEKEERSFYISECLDSYRSSEDEQAEDEPPEEIVDEQEGEETYDGTVKDYMNSLSTD